MYVTSNPYFAFHDDVFPAFGKNMVGQSPFHASFGRSTIIPDNFFSSLEELNHISTFEMKFNGTESFQFNIKSLVKSSVEELKILKWNFFDGTTLLSFGAYKNTSYWIDSDYFEKRILLKSKTTQLSELVFHFDSMESLFEVFEEQ